MTSLRWTSYRKPGHQGPAATHSACEWQWLRNDLFKVLHWVTHRANSRGPTIHLTVATDLNWQQPWLRSFQFMFYVKSNRSYVVRGRKCVRPLEHCNRGFESHSSHGYLGFSVFGLYCVGIGLEIGWSLVQDRTLHKTLICNNVRNR
jgi:hypothetical protein